MRPLIERAGRPDVVLVDPPRAGLSAEIVYLETEATRIVYVPATRRRWRRTPVRWPMPATS